MNKKECNHWPYNKNQEKVTQVRVREILRRWDCKLCSSETYTIEMMMSEYEKLVEERGK